MVLCILHSQPNKMLTKLSDTVDLSKITEGTNDRYWRLLDCLTDQNIPFVHGLFPIHALGEPCVNHFGIFWSFPNCRTMLLSTVETFGLCLFCAPAYETLPSLNILWCFAFLSVCQTNVI